MYYILWGLVLIICYYLYKMVISVNSIHQSLEPFQREGSTWMQINFFAPIASIVNKRLANQKSEWKDLSQQEKDRLIKFNDKFFGDSGIISLVFLPMDNAFSVRFINPDGSENSYMHVADILHKLTLERKKEIGEGSNYLKHG